MRRIITLVMIFGFIATAGFGLAATKNVAQEGVWVSGEVAAIENGVLSLRESNGTIFKVAATSDKLNGIHTGDRVVVKDVKGWAVSIKEIGKRTAKSSTGLTHREG
ncbi:MAG: hypothetical protein ACRENF_00520 [Thermodesulfobacteriota bacterium]